LPAHSEAALAERRRRHLYGRRKGPRLSAHQSGLIETLLPRLAFVPGTGAAAIFPSPISDLWLEIGFGAGEHLLWQAEHHPDVGLIGAEPYVSGTAKLLAKIDAQGTHLPQIRLHDGDARDIIDAQPDASLGRVFLLFPDPWPKTRHHKRRFVQMEMLDALARVMKPGAEFRFASDDAGYVEWTLERVLAHPAFAWTARGQQDWKTRPDDWPATRYEQKELHGKPAFLRFCRLPEK
jgi:tRNA (guanine-N7-)-methyltransferase